jgi:flavin-dependent dehydrogenase
VGRKRTAEFELPRAARGVSRRLLDASLVAGAIARGAHFEQRTVASLRDLGARIVVGAWGRWGRFDRELERSFVGSRERNFGFKRHYLASAAALPTGTIDLYAFQHGYLGVNAVEGGLTNICGLVDASRLTGHKGRWESFVETLRREEPQLDALFRECQPAQDHFLSSDPVIFRPRSAVEGGVFMVGDASGVIDPLTGNGMSMAIQSALVAAPLLIRLLETPSQRSAIEAEYREKHRAFFASRIRWSRMAALPLARPRLMDAALNVLPVARLGSLFLERTRASADAVARLADSWFAPQDRR